jgi:hypothetical protein
MLNDQTSFRTGGAAEPRIVSSAEPVRMTVLKSGSEANVTGDADWIGEKVALPLKDSCHSSKAVEPSGDYRNIIVRKTCVAWVSNMRNTHRANSHHAT